MEKHNNNERTSQDIITQTMTSFPFTMTENEPQAVGGKKRKEERNSSGWVLIGLEVWNQMT